MHNQSLTVRDALSRPDVDAQPGTPDRWTRFQDQVRAEVKGIKWMATMPDVAEMLGELFDIPIPGLLLTSWRKSDTLLNLLKESAEKPEEVMYLELAEHTIKRELHPYIEIRIESFPSQRLDFTVHLSFKLKGFMLRIQEGQIQEISTGRCYFGATIEFMKHTVLKKDLAPIDLPGSILLSDNGKPDSKRPAGR